MPRTYDFEHQNRHSLKNITLRGLGNVPFMADLTHAIDSISNLISNSNDELLSNRGYVVMLDGPYGVGKTTATWAVANELKVKHPNIVIFEKSLIPFGNTTEIISTFLTDIALRLWQMKIVDVRQEINQFIFEVTPVDDNTKIEAAIGPIKIGRNLSNSKHIGNLQAKLEEKFSSITNTECIFLILDDVDRLRANEIVELMRLVEKLRNLPRIVVLLPVYRDIISNAFLKINEVSASQSKSFIRKLVDFEISLNADLVTLKRIFIDTLGKVYGQIDDFSVKEYIWYCLMHNLIISEAVHSVDSSVPDFMTEFNRITRDVNISTYLLLLRNVITRLDNKQTYQQEPETDHFPTHNRDNDVDYFVPFSHDYSNFSQNTQNYENAIQLLGDMRKTNNVMKLITTDPQIIEDLRNTPQLRINFDKSAQAGSSSPAMTRFFIPLLKRSSHEALLTTNYRARDVINLARRITGDVRFKSHSSNPEVIYEIVKNVVDRYA